MLVPDNWAELLEPGLKKLFDKHTRKKKDYLKEIYNVEKSTRAQEHHQGVGSLGLMEEWGDSDNQVSYEDVNKGYKQTYTHRKYSKGMQIQRELLEDELYGEIKKKVRLLNQTLYYTRQYFAALPFNNAWSGSYLGPDSQPLCSASHPYSPVDASVWANTANYKLNATNLELVRTAMKGWKDDKGNLLGIEANLLIVPTALRKPALVIADTDKEPDVTDNNVNIWHGAIDVIEWDFLTDPNSWFVCDRERMKTFLNWYDRRYPKLERAAQEFDTEVGKYKIVGRWSQGWDEPSFVFGCTGTE